MRLDKYLADSGKGTRSEVRKIIAAGRVSVDGTDVKDPAFRVDCGSASVCLDGTVVRYAEFEYYMLNKPQGVISATRDARGSGAICVTELIHDRIRADLFPVGRLDKDTEGLLIITNDGKLSHRLLSPRLHVGKTYYVELDAELSGEEAERIMAGVDIGDDRPTLPCRIDRLSDCSCLTTIYEGRYHEIKRMYKTAGLKVTALKRISMGPLTLDPELMPGEYRELTDEEIQILKEYRGEV